MNIKNYRIIGEYLDSLNNNWGGTEISNMTAMITLRFKFSRKDIAYREKKIRDEKPVFDKMFAEQHEKAEEDLYCKSIKKATEGVNNINHRFTGDVTFSIANNLSDYTAGEMVKNSEYLALEEKAEQLNIYINQLQEKLKPLQDDLTEVRQEQRKLALSLVQEWYKEEDMNEKHRESVLGSLEKEKEKKPTSRFPFN
jgi:3-methyladenine DNA glycosylase AlkC